MKRSILIIIMTTCLCGCGGYKSVPPLSDQEMSNLYGNDAATEDTSSIASLSWRELFTDPCLQALIDTTIANNADLAIASLRVKEAEATLQASRLAYLPSVSFAPQGQISSFDGSSPAKTYSLAMSAAWELDVTGRITLQKKAAAASLQSQKDYRQAVLTQLIATVANSYYNLLTLDSQLDISRQTLDNWSETIRTLEVQKKVGETDETSVSQAKANRLEVEGSVLTLSRQIKEQENSISVLIGSGVHSIKRSSLADQQFPDQLAVGVPLQLLDNRPDIRQAEHNLQQAYYATGVARTAFYPSVTLSGTLGWTNTDGASIVNPGKWLWNAVGSLTQPLFNQGQNKASLEIAKAQQEEARVTFQQSLLQAGAEVNNALTQWQTAIQRLGIDEDRVEALESAVRSAEMQLRYSGEKTYLEVLTAQQSLLQARLAEAEDTFDKIQGVINLYHALGGGEN